MKIVILGASGMLGQMAYRYFTHKGYQVEATKERYSLENRQSFFSDRCFVNADIIINCIGAIKQKTTSEMELFAINALLPLDIVNMASKDQIVIHPSTDCVFDGQTGAPYSSNQKPQAIDAYGYSKALGEQACIGRENCFIFRTSIIGLDNNPKGKGLLSWFLSEEKGASLSGYSNHMWNGITTLEWCEQVEKVWLGKQDTLKAGKITQLGCADDHSKFEMLELFQTIFGTDYIISEIKHPVSLDRRLTPDILTKSLQSQLIEMREFW